MSDEMTDLANHIIVRRVGDQFSLTIDGQEFPWYLAPSGVATDAEPDQLARVTVTILANRVSTECGDE